MSQTVTMKPEASSEKAVQASMALRDQAVGNFPDGVALVEINEEIRKTEYHDEYKEWMDNAQVDLAIAESEDELAKGGELLDAGEVLVALWRKQFG